MRPKKVLFEFCMNPIFSTQQEFSDLSHKGLDSLRSAYDEVISPFRFSPVRMLQILPVDHASDAYWQACLAPGSIVSNVCGDAALASNGVAPGLDLIVDRSRRDATACATSFQQFFPLLRSGGVYVVENGFLGDSVGHGWVINRNLIDHVNMLEMRHGIFICRKGPDAMEIRYAARIDQLDAQVAGYVKDIDAAKAAHKEEVAFIHRSTSWRVTGPLRAVGAQLKAGKNAFSLLAAVVKSHHGGIVGVARHGVRVFRNHGFSGLSKALHRAKNPVDVYRAWIERYDTVDDEVRVRLKRLSALLLRKPVITVLMPAYSPNPLWLTEAIESVRNQIYPHWELCIADDASPNEACREVLRKFAAMDPRIKVVYRQENGHISAASNSALALATGEWTALLDHDDILPEHALFWVAEAINKYPQVRLIYSDEDKINESGDRFGAYFKPDWNADLFYSQNMFSHLGVFSTALIREVGGFRLGMEGSQDYDLVLRCIEQISSDQIIHIPRVLYHWRVHAESTAASPDAKPYAQLAGERALNEHFQRRGIRGHVEYIGHGYRAHYDLPSVPPLVSLIIPTRNAASLVKQCIDSIEALTTYSNYEIILVNNGSDDPAALAYFAELALRPGYRLLRDDNEFNYSALNNRAVAVAAGEVVALINNDIEVISPEWLSEMVSLALQPGIGAVGARLWYPDGTLQHGGVVLGVGGIGSHSHKALPKGQHGYFGRAALIQSFSAVTAACLVVRKASYQAVGGLDENHLKVAYNDVDFCLRLRDSGFRNVWTPFAELIHHESATRGLDDAPEKKARFAAETDYMMSKWGTLLPNDPAYNPNLTMGADDFGLAWPPRIQNI